MKDKWYGDNRDLVKWGTLLELARRYRAKQILQVPYYVPNEWEQIEVDGKKVDIAKEVIEHFRSLGSIQNLFCSVPIKVLKDEFVDRSKYLQSIIATVRSRSVHPGVVFLDPDTGLEPPSGNHGPTHVLDSELVEIWKSLSSGDLLVVYQHETNRRGEEFVGPKMRQFVSALGIVPDRVKLAHAPRVARDVAFFYAEKS